MTNIILHHVRYEVLIALKIQTEVFCVVILCSVAEEYKDTGGHCSLHLQGEVNGAGKRAQI
jgi:hypothetical protein